MKQITFTMLALALAWSLLFNDGQVGAADTFNDTDTALDQRDDQPEVDGSIIRNGKLGGKRIAKSANAKFRASQLKGMNIQNGQGKEIGEVRDIVLDVSHKRVQYVVVSYGGLLGLGDKLFAVPYEAFEMALYRSLSGSTANSEHKDQTDPALVLNVTEQQLEDEKGFDQEHWPNFANAEFAQNLDNRYGIERRLRPKTNGDQTQLHQAGKIGDKLSGANIRISQLIGMDIQNSKGEDVGDVADIVLDCNTGKVRYAAVTYGGLLGLGDKLFAVPFRAFQLGMDRDDLDEDDAEDIDYVLILDVTQKQLEGDKGFDQEHWPDFANSKYTDGIDKRYGVEIQVGPRGVRIDINAKEETDQ